MTILLPGDYQEFFDSIIAIHDMRLAVPHDLFAQRLQQSAR